MTSTNWNLDQNQYSQIVTELKNGATVNVNIGLFAKTTVTVPAVIFDGYAYELHNGTLCRWDAKYDFPNIVAQRDFDKPENVAIRQAWQVELDKEAEKTKRMSEWFLAHPSA